MDMTQHYKRNVFRYPHHEKLEVSWICSDVAHIMLALTDNNEFDGQEHTGPEALKNDIARHLSNRYLNISIHTYSRIWKNYG